MVLLTSTLFIYEYVITSTYDIKYGHLAVVATVGVE